MPLLPGRGRGKNKVAPPFGALLILRVAEKIVVNIFDNPSSRSRFQGNSQMCCNYQDSEALPAHSSGETDLG